MAVDQAARVGREYVATVLGAGVFAITVEDRAVPLLDLDPEHVAQIARLTGIAWAELVDAPLNDLAAALALVAAAETVEGATERRPKTVAELVDRFVRLPATPTSNGQGP